MRHDKLTCGRILLAFGILIAAAAVAQTATARQYKFSGECNGLPHWVSLLYDTEHDHISNLVIRASCPTGEPSVYRIHRDKIIPVYMGGAFSRVIKYPGVDYVITGRILSKSKAVLSHKGPIKTLTCPGSEPPRANVCERFELKAN